MSTPTIDNARRHLALAQLLLSCSAPTSIDEAVSHAEEAVRAVKALRDEAAKRVGLRRVAGEGT